MASRSVSRERHNQDGWVNLLKGFGAEATDPRLHTSIGASRALTEQELNEIYRSEGLGTRLIDVLVEDMTREWFRVTGDTEDRVNDALRAFRGKAAILKCLRAALLHGGALGVMGIDDGGSYEKPYVAGTRHRGIKFIHCFDRWRVRVDQSDLYDDPAEDNFRQPEFYTITPFTTGAAFRVHESRVLRFEGKDVPERVRVSNGGWADSELQSVYERLRGLGTAYAGLETAVSEFVISILSVHNLQGLIASGQEALVKRRLLLLDMCKRMMGTMLVDENEQFQRLGTPIAGLPEAVRELILGVSSAVGIPVTRLMGQSPAGLNATGDSDIRDYYDHIAGLQEERLEPPLTKLASIIYDSIGGAPANWKIEFQPLWQPTEQEIIAMRGSQANTDIAYINAGVLTAEEVALARFGGDQWSKDTKLLYKREIKTPEEQAEEKMEFMQAGAAAGGGSSPEEGTPRPFPPRP